MPKRPFLSIEDILGKNVTRNRPSDEQKMTTSLDSARRKELRCATDLSQSRNDLYHAKERRFTNSAIQQHLYNDFSDSRGHAYTINDLQPRLPTTLQLCSPSLDFCDMRERGYTSSQIQSHLIGKDQRCSICSPPCYRSPVATNRLNPTWIRYYSAFTNHQILRQQFLRQPRKRLRASFSHEQVMVLQKAFDENKYVGSNERRDLARKLRMTEQQVKIWFQNRRYKEKRKQKQDIENEAMMSLGNSQNEDDTLNRDFEFQRGYKHSLDKDIQDEFQVFPISDDDECFDLLN